MFDPIRLKKHVDGNWDDAIVPSLFDYIKIPNKSPAYDAEWEKHGYMDDAVKLMEAWARSRVASFPGATLEVVKLKGRTPVRKNCRASSSILTLELGEVTGG